MDVTGDATCQSVFRAPSMASSVHV